MSRRPSSPNRAPARPAATPLDVSIRHTPEQTVVRLAGEIDQDNAPVLREALEGSLAPCPARLHVDAAAVSFCDSSGLHALLRARDDAAQLGAELTLGPSDQLAGLLRVTGTTALFPAAPAPPHRAA